MATIVILPLASDIQRALDRLKSLHDGDLGVPDIIACGRRAIPALRALLLEASRAVSIIPAAARSMRSLR